MNAPAIPIWPIKGGVHPDFHKEESTQHAIAQSGIPDKLIIPARQHIGMGGEILVKPGDHVLKGQPLTAPPEGLGTIVHAPTSGTITVVERLRVPHISGLSCPSIIIEPDHRDDWGDYQLPPISDYQSTDEEVLLQRVRDAGLVGMGGAAFPAAVKLGAANKSGLKTLVINGAECEPYITCDDMLMRERAREVIEGIRILLRMVKPERCLVGIEDNKPQAIAAMQQALEASKEFRIKIISIPAIYPSGDEKQLMKILTGVEIPRGTFPFDLGLLCHNIATAHSTYKAVIKGEPLISRIVTVTGKGIHAPGNFEALIGTPFSHLVKKASGYTRYAERLIMGGPMMGYPMQTDDIPIIKATNCILALPESDLPYSTELAMPCIRCGKCMEACPVNLLPQQMYWHSRADDFEKAEEHHLFDCIECGCCSYVCPSNIPLVSYYRYAKSSIRTEKEKQQKTEQARQRHEFRDFRKEREKQERDAKRAKHKAALQKKKAGNSSKQAAIKAAMERAKAKKASQETPRNTDNLTESQQKQIDEANTRRKTIQSDTASSGEE
jgi:electron transport complex protein RnfC